MSLDASICICTRNRATSLRRTLTSLADATKHSSLAYEVLVIDNNSSDNTKLAVNEFSSILPIFYVFEAKKGVANARNTALKTVRGEIILFTDDDILFPAQWLDDMCHLILTGKADAVAGGIVLAPYLERPWMMQDQKPMFGENIDALQRYAPAMLGGSMAFHRRVLAQVPRFDPTLGPGQLGTYEELLFALQVNQAGYTTVALPEVQVLHCLEEDRLERDNLVKQRIIFGKCRAYVAYHWEHVPIPSFIHLRYAKAILRWYWHRFLKGHFIKAPKTVAIWENDLLTGIGYYAQLLKERHNPRNYTYHGLVLLTSMQLEQVVA